MKIGFFVHLFIALLMVSAPFAQWHCSAEESGQVQGLGQAQVTIRRSLAELDLTRDAPGFLLLTNAYYGRFNGKTAEIFRDVLAEETGCSAGRRTLLDVHTPYNEPLWFALYHKDRGKLIFSKWVDGAFQSQIVDASPDKILTTEMWREASSGLIGKKTLFQVVSISLAWAGGADWPIIKAAGFHDHICPGVNIGYLIHHHLKKQMPAGKGDKYVFFGALPKCYMDTLQMVYDATLGKQMAYGITMSEEQLAAYRSQGAVPSVIALKVNHRADTCSGAVYGFDWETVMNELGIPMNHFAPTEGPKNPVFFIARAKACWEMAQMKTEDKMKWIKVLKTFSGDAKLAGRIANAGGDPYALIWNTDN